MAKNYVAVHAIGSSGSKGPWAPGERIGRDAFDHMRKELGDDAWQRLLDLKAVRPVGEGEIAPEPRYTLPLDTGTGGAFPPPPQQPPGPVEAPALTEKAEADAAMGRATDEQKRLLENKKPPENK